MPSAARPAGSTRVRTCLVTATIGLLAALMIVANPFASRASATAIPIVFPLEKRVTVLHDYLAPRVGHLHQGTDLMAPKMTREMAAVGGIVTLRVSSYNGLPSYSLWLAGDDGHGYFYIHINNDTPGTDDGAGGLQYAFAPGLQSGMHVQKGQFIAYVGDSGNAESVGPHLHFEIHETTSISSPSMDPYDSLIAAPLYNETQPPVGVTRYEQSNANILYLGTWIDFSATGASGGSYKYADSPARAIITFKGTRLDLIATRGVTQGKARVYLDGADKGVIDFSATSTVRQVKVWSTGTVTSAAHKVELIWLGQAGVAGGTRINVDAVDVAGALTKAALPAIEQTDTRFHYAGTWATVDTTSASGGSLAETKTGGSSVTLHFHGSYLVWLTRVSSSCGIAKVSVDGKTPVLVDLYSATTYFKKAVWNTGVLPYGAHTVVISWNGTKNASALQTTIGIDAVQVLGTLD